MAFIDHNSCECVKSELDLFSVPPTQTSIESGHCVEYNPISSIGDGTPIEFFVGGNGEEYIDLASTQIYATVQIVKANGDAITADDAVGPVNLLLHALFAEVDIKLGDTLVTTTSNTYPYRAYLETLLNYGKDAKDTQLQSALFFKDVAGYMDEANPRAENAHNRGLVDRHHFFRLGRIVPLLGRLHCDIFFQERFLPSGINIKIRLVRNKDSFCLMSNTPDSLFKLKIHECKLLMRKVMLSSSVYLSLERALTTANMKYPIRRVVCKTFTVPAQNMNCTQEALFTGQMPVRLVIAAVDNDAFNGAYGKNPFNFKNFNLRHLKVHVDGQAHQVKPLEIDYMSNQFVQAYMSLFSGAGKAYKNEGNAISRAEFPRGYSVYAFDLSPDINDAGDHFNLLREGSLRIDMAFAQPLDNTINVIAYAEFENVLQIDRSKHILFDYST